jgi:heme/copper-type cytochrome/quinol oxidase subunit 1
MTSMFAARGLLGAFLMIGVTGVAVGAHHSYAMFDQAKC